MKMKKLAYIFSLAAVLAFAACTKEEPLVIQQLPSPGNELRDAQYYENLRAWKKTDHVLTYVYYAAYAPLEGSSNLYKEYSSMSDRFIALPDSLDIVNLWMGIPTADSTLVYKYDPAGVNSSIYNYSPHAAADMKYCQEVKGTRFVMHADASHDWTFTREDGTEFSVLAGGEEELRHYANFILEQMNNGGLDGVDIDYEPNDHRWTGKINRLVEMLSESIGPASAHPEKLLIVDYYGGYPSNEIEPLLSYLVRQAYGGLSYSYLGNPSYPASKLIICEQWNDSRQAPGSRGDGYPTVRGYDGQPLMTWYDGVYQNMGSLEAYARFCMDENAKGYGAYYIDSDFFFSKGPYYNLRRCIQIANPSIR